MLPPDLNAIPLRFKKTHVEIAFLRLRPRRAMSVPPRPRSHRRQMDCDCNPAALEKNDALRRAAPRDRRHLAKDVDSNAAQSGTRRLGGAQSLSGCAATS